MAASARRLPYFRSGAGVAVVADGLNVSGQKRGGHVAIVEARRVGLPFGYNLCHRRRTVEDGVKRILHPLHVVGSHVERGVAPGLLKTRPRGSHHRPAALKSLKHRNAEPLIPRRIDNSLGQLIDGRKVGKRHVGTENNPLPDAQFSGNLLHPLLIALTVASHGQQLNVRRKIGERTHGQLQVLAALDRAYLQHVSLRKGKTRSRLPPLLLSQRPPKLPVAALVDHVDLVMVDAIQLHHVALRALADGNHPRSVAARTTILEIVDEPVDGGVAFRHTAIDHVVDRDHRRQPRHADIEWQLVAETVVDVHAVGAEMVGDAERTP